MKRTILYLPILLFVFIILFAAVFIGCMSNPPKIAGSKIPSLPPEVAQLSAYFGEPKTAEAYAIVLIWNIDGERHHVLFIYDPFIGDWLTHYYKYGGVSSPGAVY